MPYHFVTILLPFFVSVTQADNQKFRALSSLQTEANTVIHADQYASQLGIQGYSLAVIDDYKIAWTHSYGVSSSTTKKKVDSGTLFSTASISKAVTGTLVVLLHEKGLIDLDAPVDVYLKRWKLPQSPWPDAKPISIRSLLSHTSGLNQHGFKDFYRGEPIPSLIQVLEGGDLPGTERLQFVLEPHTQWKYSGGGYVIVQLAIEDHMGVPFKSLAQKYLFDPLNLKQLTFYQPGESEFPQNSASAHTLEGMALGLPICPQLTASGLWATPSQLALFLIEVQRAASGKKTRVITQSMAETFSTPMLNFYGLGWMSIGSIDGQWQEGWMGHGGANTGTGADMLGSNKGYGLVLMANGPNQIRFKFFAKLSASIVKAHQWPTHTGLGNQ